MVSYDKQLKALSQNLRRNMTDAENMKSPLAPLACLCGREKIAKEGKEMEIFAKEV
jgi:hypothetical protein